MSGRVPRSRAPGCGLPALLGAGLLLVAAAARADDAPEGRDPMLSCIDAHVDAQRFRKVGKLVAARKQAIACAQEACPAPLRGECARWVPELDDLAPTILVEPGADAAGARLARVAVDGEERAEAPAGKAIALDPGEHALSIRLADGTVVERSIVIYEGEKRRRIAIDVAPARLPEPLAPAPCPPPLAPVATSRWPAWPVLALAGASAAALGTFAGFAVAGREKQAALEASCAPRCGADDVATMRRDFLVADVALGAAVIAAGGAIAWQLWGGRGEGKAAATVGVTIAARPGGAAVGGVF